MKNNTTSSGFVGINIGTIEDCYTSVKLNSKYSSGFCVKNGGTIKNSYSSSILRGKNRYGFCQNINGVEDSFFVDSKKANSETSNETDESKIAVSADELTKDYFKENNWNIKNVWNIQEDKLPTFYYKDLDVDFDLADKKKFSISSSDDLFDFCNKVNDGDTDAKNAYVFLENDINLKGKKWTSIGIDESTAFSGVFNGNGYKIHNFKLSSNDNAYVDFFGVCDNASIFNLTLDCKINSDSTVGGFIAISNNTTIKYCGIAIDAKIKRNVSAFVAKNNGHISQCYAVGSGNAGIPLLPLWIILTLLLIASVMYFALKPTPDTPASYYKEVPTDSNVEADDGTAVDGQNAENSVSLEFNPVITAQTGTSDALISFRNPKGKYVNQYVVVKIQITDEVLISKIGKTGRTAEEQQQLEKDTNYNKKTSRVTIANSGAVATGQKLRTIKLNPLPDGTVLPKGEYKAVLFFEFYDSTTNVKSSVNAQSPVTIEIKG